jgi:hypothetical protein
MLAEIFMARLEATPRPSKRTSISRVLRRNGVQQLEPVPDRRDSKLLQSLMRQARKNRLINFVFAECLLVPFETKAPQPHCPSARHRPHSVDHIINREWRLVYRVVVDCLRARPIAARGKGDAWGFESTLWTMRRKRSFTTACSSLNTLTLRSGTLGRWRVNRPSKVALWRFVLL